MKGPAGRERDKFHEEKNVIYFYKETDNIRKKKCSRQARIVDSKEYYMQSQESPNECQDSFVQLVLTHPNDDKSPLHKGTYMI